jgi:hypothetical protein
MPMNLLLPAAHSIERIALFFNNLIGPLGGCAKTFAVT